MPGRSSRYKGSGGGGGGGGGGGAVTYAETVKATDGQKMGWKHPDTVKATDLQALGFVLPESLKARDGYSITAVDTKVEPLKVRDVQRFGSKLFDSLKATDVIAMGARLPDNVKARDVIAMGSVLPDNAKARDVQKLGFLLPDTLKARDVLAMGARLPDNVKARDVLAMGSLQPDNLKARDVQKLGFLLPDTVKARDVLAMGMKFPDLVKATDLQAFGWKHPDNVKARDAGKYNLANYVVGRSGTPDTDKMSDGWADQAATGVNHGNESLLAKGASTVPGADERQAFLQLSLATMTGHSAGVVGASLGFIASTSNAVLATTLTIGYAVQAGQWFTESTMTWATGRPTPTFTSLGTLNISTGAAQLQFVNISQANLNLMIGKWVVFRFTTATGAVPDTVTILSRDNATASNRPYLEANVTIV